MPASQLEDKMWAGARATVWAWQDERLCAFAGKNVDKILCSSRERYIFNRLAYYGFYIELFWTYLVYCRTDWAKWVESCPDTKYSLWLAFEFVQIRPLKGSG